MHFGGWFRLWIFLSAIVLMGTGLALTYFTYGKESCYRLISVSVANDAVGQDKALAESIRPDVTKHVYCGSNEYSDLLTLEQLAKRGAVTQVGFEWLEPRGWTFTKFDMLDIVNGKEITATNIIDRAKSYVHNSRLILSSKLLGLAVAFCVTVLAIGLGIAWVRKGFRQGSV